jgi:hypothetical protein
VKALQIYDRIGESIDLKLSYIMNKNRQVKFGLIVNVESSEKAYTYKQTTSVIKALTKKIRKFHFAK